MDSTEKRPTNISFRKQKRGRMGLIRESDHFITKSKLNQRAK